MDSHANDLQKSKLQKPKKKAVSLEMMKNFDWQSMFKIEDIKKIRKFDGVDDSSQALLTCKNSSTDFILASLLELLCKMQANDQKVCQTNFKDISHFLINKNLLSSSSTLDEFQGIRANISKILFNILFFKQMQTPFKTLTQNIQIHERYKHEFDDTGQIGKGGFGSVRKAINKLDGQHYAIKKIWFKNNENSFEISKIFDEVKTLASLKHKYIVSYNSAWLEYDIFMTDSPPSNESSDMEYSSYSHFTPSAGFQRLNIKELESPNLNDFSDSSDNQLCNQTDSPIIYQTCKTLYIQMELCQQTLEDWLNSRNLIDKPLIERIDIVNNLKIVNETVEGLEFIHSKGIIHRDIKPANIFLQHNFSVKIGDFGLAKRSYSSDSDVSEENFLSHSVGVGTSTYSAPEQLNSSNYNTKSDIYSLGLIIYELYYSFTTICERSDLFNTLRQTSEVDDFVTENFPDMAELIKKMTNKNPVERLTAQDILKQFLCPSKDDIIRDQKEEIESLRNEVKELKLLLRSYEERMPTEK